MKRLLHCRPVRVPFREKFAHNTAVREETETIIVKIENEHGEAGFGESCPRSYVTGETIESCQNYISTVKEDFINIQSLSQLQEYCLRNADDIDKNPAAFCALELALLDLIARENKMSVSSLLGLNSANEQSSSPYTAVLGIETWPKFLKKLLLYKLMGFSDFKLKISGTLIKDLEKIKFLSLFASKIRIDGNNVFQNEEAAIAYLKPLSSYIWAVEEPLQASDFEGMKKINQACGLYIILDESFKNATDIKRLSEFMIPNLRISKMGGLLRTLSIINELEKNNQKWILGSHVGEMSLLAKAALLLSRHCPKAHALEGGFGTFLLKEDYFAPNIRLGIGAKIKHNIPQNEKGFGQELRFKL